MKGLPMQLQMWRITVGVLLMVGGILLLLESGAILYALASIVALVLFVVIGSLSGKAIATHDEWEIRGGMSSEDDARN